MIVNYVDPYCCILLDALKWVSANSMLAVSLEQPGIQSGGRRVIITPTLFTSCYRKQNKDKH